MYFGPVSGADVTYLQALARFPGAPTSDSWWTSFTRRMRAASALLDISSAFRLCLRADGGVDRLFSAVFDTRSENSARRFFGGLSFLEGIEEDSVQLPADRLEFESWTGDFPTLKARVMPTPLQVASGTWLACDFRIAGHLEGLLQEAQSLGFTFAYQVHFRPFTPDRELLRRVGRNLIALQDISGIPRGLVAAQKRQVEALRTASTLIEEIVGTDKEEAARWLAGAIERAFRAECAREPLEPPQVELTEGDCGTDLTLMMHSSLLCGDWSDDDLYCSQALQDNFRTSVVCYRPQVEIPQGSPASRSTRGPASPREPLPPLPAGLTLPALHEGRGHIFVSYPHSDFQRVAPILQRLAAKGLPVWYDRGIYGGEEWDEVLERKIQDAGMILVFLSRATVDSKYCRREIKFADAINRPLLVVSLEPTALQHGLSFLLQAVQQISAGDAEFELLLDRSIRKLLGN
jgi:TIR domain